MILGTDMTRRLHYELGELEKLFEFNPAWFNDWEKRFVTDSLQRFKEYGFRAYFNDAQEKKISVLLEKITHKAIK